MNLYMFCGNSSITQTVEGNNVGGEKNKCIRQNKYNDTEDRI